MQFNLLHSLEFPLLSTELNFWGQQAFPSVPPYFQGCNNKSNLEKSSVPATLFHCLQNKIIVVQNIKKKTKQRPAQFTILKLTHIQEKKNLFREILPDTTSWKSLNFIKKLFYQCIKVVCILIKPMQTSNATSDIKGILYEVHLHTDYFSGV